MRVSPAKKKKTPKKAKRRTVLVVVHPVEHDLGRSVPARGHVSRHLVVRLPGQAEVKDLDQGWGGGGGVSDRVALKQGGMGEGRWEGGRAG